MTLIITILVIALFGKDIKSLINALTDALNDNGLNDIGESKTGRESVRELIKDLEESKENVKESSAKKEPKREQAKIQLDNRPVKIKEVSYRGGSQGFYKGLFSSKTNNKINSFYRP